MDEAGAQTMSQSQVARHKHSPVQTTKQKNEDLFVLRLSPSDQIRLVESLLDEDAEPSPAMRRAAQHHAKLFR